MEHPKQRSQVRKTQSTARRKYPYSFEEETSIVARSIINVVQSSRIDAHPLVVALLECKFWNFVSGNRIITWLIQAF